jgi:hypothetical protein
MVSLLLCDGGWKSQHTPKDHALQFQFGTNSLHSDEAESKRRPSHSAGIVVGKRFHACLDWFPCYTIYSLP